VSQLRECVVIVPSGAAADQLRRSLEDEAFGASSAGTASVDRAICFPRIVTRAGWYGEMHRRLASPPPTLSDLEREVLLSAAAGRAVAGGSATPFKLRAGLLAAMLRFYDELRRRNVTTDRFQSATTEELAQDADADRGAQRLLQQTKFLASAFREYEAGVAASESVDEHALRARLLEERPAHPLRHVIVTVGDRTGDPNGLWKADFDLLARLPLLAHVDVIATERALASGFLDRIRDLLPEIEELFFPESEEDRVKLCSRPVLGAPGGASGPFYISRDREEEIAGIAERLKVAPLGGPGGRGAPLDRVAIVFKRPLPYMYLAREVFSDAGIPHQTFDALPLAAEPYAAALDLIFDFVTSGATRQAVVDLLGSPHFTFETDGPAVTRRDVDELDRALSETSYLGGHDRLQVFAEGVSTGRNAGLNRAARAAASIARELAPLFSGDAPSRQLAALGGFLRRHDRRPEPDGSLGERHMRARAAIRAAIHALQRAHQRFDAGRCDFSDVAAMIRRWIEGQTFAPRTGTAGVQLLAADAARYGDFDRIHLVGLVDGEWPERAAGSIFYPHAVLLRFGWPDAKAPLAAERAAFEDLLGLARRRVELSTFKLENDSIVSPSVLLEDVDRMGITTVSDSARPAQRVFSHQALTEDPVVPAAALGEAAEWLQIRMERSPATDAVFHGSASPHRPQAYAIRGLETYLQCPFRFFAERVLALEEEPEDEPARTPQARGIFVHRVFQAFFDLWVARGYQAMTSQNLGEARSIFEEVALPLLNELPEGDAAVERARLLGSAVDEGLAEAVFRLEAEWGTPTSARLLEYRFTGEFDMAGEAGIRRVPLRGIADRIDLLEDGTFRLIDYKLGRAPERLVALQLPIYTVCASQQLRITTGREWEPGEAGYIAFGERSRFKSMIGRGSDRSATLVEAQARLLRAIDGIERGEFPPHPYEVSLCQRCPHAAVCRKDYVGDV
jgi:RecB family exonuclease